MTQAPSHSLEGLDEEALEAAALARWNKVREQWTSECTRPVPWEKLTQFERDGYLAEDRAAIEAYLSSLAERGMRVMPREPNEAMRKAGEPAAGTLVYSEYFENGPGWKSTPDKCWRAMFDAHPSPTEGGGDV